ncbi:MAG: WD40 repeat domain-containing protein [Fimbriimonadaceae bacterium]
MNTKTLGAALLLSACGIGIAAPPPIEWQTSFGLNNRVEIAPDGSRLVAQTTTGIDTFNVATGIRLSTFVASGTVNAIHISRDGSLGAVGTSGTGNTVARIFDTSSGTLVATLNSPGTGGIFAVQFSKNGSGVQHFAMGNATDNRRVRVYSDDGAGNWDWVTFSDFGDVLDLAPADVAFNVAGTQFAVVHNTSGTNPRSVVYTIASPGGPTVTHNVPSGTFAFSTSSTIAWAPDNSRIIVTGTSALALYTPVSPTQVGSTVTGLSTCRDSHVLADSSAFIVRNSNEIQTRSLADGSLVGSYLTGGSNTNWISLSPTTNVIVGTAVDQALRTWTVGDPNPTVLVPSVNIGGDMRFVTVSPGGTQVVTARAITERTLFAFNAATGALQWTYLSPFTNDRINDAAYSPDGTTIYMFIRANSSNAPSPNNRVSRVLSADGTPAGADFIPTTSGTSTSATEGGVAVSPDGSLVALMQIGNRVLTIWNIGDGTVLADTASVPGGNSANIVFSPDGTRLAVGTRGTGENRIYIYPVSPGPLTPSGSTPSQGSAPSWIDWSPNGKFLVGRFGTQLVRFNAASVSSPPQVLAAVTSSTTAGIHISSDSRYVISAEGASGISIVNAVTGAVVASYDSVGTVRPVQFSPLSNAFFFANTAGTVFRASFAPAPVVTAKLYWQNTGTGQIVRWSVAGGSVTGSKVVTVSPNTLRATADVNNDGIKDLLIQDESNGSVTSLLLDADDNVTGSQPVAGAVGAQWRLVGSGDMDGANGPDLLWQNSVTGQVAQWLMTPTGSVITGRNVALVPAWDAIGVRDVNGDGIADIMFRNPTTTGMAIWFMAPNADVVSSVLTGTTGLDWSLELLAGLSLDSATPVFLNSITGQVVFWELTQSGSVVTPGVSLGTAPSGWRLGGSN